MIMKVNNLKNQDVEIEIKFSVNTLERGSNKELAEFDCLEKAKQFIKDSKKINNKVHYYINTIVYD